MKSERKLVQESTLIADKIEQQAIKLKRALPAILAVTAVVVLGLLAYGFYTSVSEKESAKGWTALYFADTEASDLTAISSDFSGTTAAVWAKQTSGDANMAKALEKVYIDRDLAEQFYKEATAEYKSVVDKSSDQFLTGRANFGLAQAAEGLGERDQALSFYRKVITNKAMGLDLIAEATKRVSWLESNAGEDFFAWYKSNRPAAPVLKSEPAVNPPLPSAPDFTFKNSTTTGQPATNNPEVALPAKSENETTPKTESSTEAPINKIELPKTDDVPAAKNP